MNKIIAIVLGITILAGLLVWKITSTVKSVSSFTFEPGQIYLVEGAGNVTRTKDGKRFTYRLVRILQVYNDEQLVEWESYMYVFAEPIKTVNCSDPSFQG
jgi:hypothetical protein